EGPEQPAPAAARTYEPHGPEDRTYADTNDLGAPRSSGLGWRATLTTHARIRDRADPAPVPCPLGPLPSPRRPAQPAPEHRPPPQDRPGTGRCLRDRVGRAQTHGPGP